MFFDGDERMIKSYGISKTGLVRKVNEDCIFAKDKPYFILADGMGGYEGGQVASTTAVDAACTCLDEADPSSYSEAQVKEAVCAANRAVLRKKVEVENLQHMGTTMIIAVISGHVLYWGHVGDSRLYVLYQGNLTQITKDHSFVMTLVDEGKITKEEMREHPRKNEITRAVGIAPQLDVDTGHLDLAPHMIVLICSDGVSALLDDACIRDLLLPLERKEADLKTAAEQILRKVYDAGATDNTSIILIQLDEDEL